MKKNLKRTISIFMAVIMVITTWVFIAPQKASATDAGKYKYQIVIDTTDNADIDGSITIKLNYKKNNGAGGSDSVSKTVNKSWFESKGQNSWVVDNVDGFATGVNLNYKIKGLPLAIGKRTLTYTVNLYIYNFNKTDNAWERLATGGDSLTHSGTTSPKQINKTYCNDMEGDDYPRAQDIYFENNPTNVTVPETGSTTVNFRTYLLDQYGVRINGSSDEYFSQSYSFTTSQNCDTGISLSHGTSGGTYEPYTFTITSEAKSQTFDTNSVTVTISHTFNGYAYTDTFSDSKTFTVSDPQYQYILSGNGGTIAPIPANSRITKYYWNTMPANQIPNAQKSTKIGREFIGMYDTPISDSYALTKPVAGSTSGYTGNLTASTRFTSNKTWYAAWWVKNCDVVFVNNAGQVKKTIKAKYGTKVTDLYNAEEWAKITDDLMAYVKAPDEGSYDFYITDYVLVEAYDLDGNNITSSSNFGSSINDSYYLVGKTIYQPVYTRSDNMPSKFDVSFWCNGTKNTSNYSYGDLPAQPSASMFNKTNTNEYTYEFIGWKIRDDQEIANGSIEKIVNEDEYASTVSDFTVRKEVEYIPVFLQKKVEYTIAFLWSENGANGFLEEKSDIKKINWGDPISVPEVPAYYKTNGLKWNFLGWDCTIPEVLDETNTLGVGLSNTQLTISASYGNPEVTQYEIKFLDKDGNETEYGASYDHAAAIQVAPDLPIYRNDSNTKEYQFVKWVDQFGNVFYPVALADYTYSPVFEEFDIYPVNYYNDGKYVGTNYYREGQSILEPDFDEAIEKPEDMLASTYTFIGWRTGEGWLLEAGDEQVTTMPAQEVNLYAKYDPDYKNYTVTFYNDVIVDGEKVVLQTRDDYHYGDKVEPPTTDPTKAKDATYSYTFRGWDKIVATKCDGNATYTASYRKSYNYYNVIWLDKDGNELKNENLIWNERINVPARQVEPPESSSAVQSYVHSGWQYVTSYTVDENGRITGWDSTQLGEVFNFGERMTNANGLVFAPTFELVDSTYTIDVYNEAGTTVQYSIEAAHGTDINNILGAPQKGYDDVHHYEFKKWYDVDSNTEIPTGTTLTGNISVKPVYELEEHVFDPDFYNVTKEPTYYLTGTADAYCTSSSCGYCKEVVLPVKTDATSPEGILYVKNHAPWTTEENASGTDGETMRVGKYSQIIINARDYYISEGTEQPGSGVREISEYISVGTYISDPSTISAWDETVSFVETDENGDPVTDEENGGDKLLDINANLTKFVRNLDKDDEFVSAENGKIQAGDYFYVYYKIVDRIGNVSYVNSCKLYYDAQQPEITFTSRYKSKDADNYKHCLGATFTVTDSADDEVTVYVDGVIVTPVAGEYTVEADQVGIHQITAIDLAGNITRINFEIVGKHTTKVYNVNATCKAAGAIITKCTLCEEELNRVTVDQLDHQYGEYLVIEPTCSKAGSKTRYCFMCGLPDKVELPATNEHDYGEWKTTKEATCVSEGEQIRTCSMCKRNDTQVIPIDENAHKYYRGKVVKPTCTEQGYTIHICRYNTDHFYKDAYTEATGHVMADEWTVTIQPTCTEAGERVRYCAKGCLDADDNPYIVDDPDRPGEKMIETIPALGHYWIYDSVVEPTTTEEGYTIYKCGRAGCTEVKYDDFKPVLNTYTVEFLNEDGSAYVEAIEKNEGETILRSSVADPTKASDARYKYEFISWVKAVKDESDNYVATEEEFSFSDPITSNLVLMPKFKSRFINYTLTLKKENNSDLVANIGYLHAGDTYTITKTQANYQDEINNYIFEGWVEDETDTPKMEIVITGDMTLYAKFKAVAKEYNVIFRKYNSNTAQGIIEKAVANTAVAYDSNTNDFTYIVYADADKTTTQQEIKHIDPPTRAYTDAGHYVFAGWENEGLDCLKSNMLVKPIFTLTAHKYKGTIIQEKTTCDTREVTQYICEDCGYTKNVVTQPKTQHQWPTTSNGSGKIKCEACGLEKDDTNTFTVTFMSYDNETIYKIIAGQFYGTDISDRVPTNVEKKSDVEYDYTFIGWSKEPNGPVVSVETIVTKDETYYPIYTSTARTYTVIYAYDNNNVIKVFYNVPAYGSVEGVSETPVNNDYDDYVHYEFDRWSSDGTNIVEDTYIIAIFKEIPHTEEVVNTVPATCEHGAGTEYKCTGCGYRYVKSTGKPLSHSWQVIDYKAPELEVEGYEVRECVNCHKTETEILPAKQYYYITITVLDSKDIPVENARVSLYDPDKKNEFVASGRTNADGKVTLRVVEKKTYTIVIDRDDFGSVTGTITVNDDGSVSMDVPPIVTHECKCTCHRSGIWPSIFRFFHKIVKLLTGEFGCCSCPDERYY